MCSRGGYCGFEAKPTVLASPAFRNIVGQFFRLGEASAFDRKVVAVLSDQFREDASFLQQAIVDPTAVAGCASEAVGAARVIQKRDRSECMSLDDHNERQQFVAEANSRKQQCKVQTRCVATAKYVVRVANDLGTIPRRPALAREP